MVGVVVELFAFLKRCVGILGNSMVGGYVGCLILLMVYVEDRCVP